MNKQEFIEKLKGHVAWCKECHDINGEKDRYVKVAKVRELLEQLDEPQAEKVEVPDFVAEWYEENKDDVNQAMYDITIDIHSNRRTTEFEKWFSDSRNDTYGTIARMKDGYTVKPKRWVVKQDGSEVWYLKGFGTNLDGEIIKRWCSHEGCVKFTDKAQAEAVAVLVEGSVEEI